MYVIFHTFLCRRYVYVISCVLLRRSLCMCFGCFYVGSCVCVLLLLLCICLCVCDFVRFCVGDSVCDFVCVSVQVFAYVILCVFLCRCLHM